MVTLLDLGSLCERWLQNSILPSHSPKTHAYLPINQLTTWIGCSVDQELVEVHNCHYVCQVCYKKSPYPFDGCLVCKNDQKLIQKGVCGCNKYRQQLSDISCSKFIWQTRLRPVFLLTSAHLPYRLTLRFRWAKRKWREIYIYRYLLHIDLLVIGSFCFLTTPALSRMDPEGRGIKHPPRFS